MRLVVTVTFKPDNLGTEMYKLNSSKVNRITTAIEAVLRMDGLLGRHLDKVVLTQEQT